jgi:hypothetical protein
MRMQIFPYMYHFLDYVMEIIVQCFVKLFTKILIINCEKPKSLFILCIHADNQNNVKLIAIYNRG